MRLFSPTNGMKTTKVQSNVTSQHQTRTGDDNETHMLRSNRNYMSQGHLKMNQSATSEFSPQPFQTSEIRQEKPKTPGYYIPHLGQRPNAFSHSMFSFDNATSEPYQSKKGTRNIQNLLLSGPVTPSNVLSPMARIYGHSHSRLRMKKRIIRRYKIN